MTSITRECNEYMQIMCNQDHGNGKTVKYDNNVILRLLTSWSSEREQKITTNNNNTEVTVFSATFSA